MVVKLAGSSFVKGEMTNPDSPYARQELGGGVGRGRVDSVAPVRGQSCVGWLHYVYSVHLRAMPNAPS